MKKILITGANSYVGTSFENWVAQWPDKYSLKCNSKCNSQPETRSIKHFTVVFSFDSSSWKSSNGVR